MSMSEQHNIALILLIDSSLTQYKVEMFVPEEVWHVVGDAVVADGDGEPDEEEDTSSLPQDRNSENVSDVWRPPGVLSGHQVPRY